MELDVCWIQEFFNLAKARIPLVSESDFRFLIGKIGTISWVFSWINPMFLKVLLYLMRCNVQVICTNNRTSYVNVATQK